MPKHRSLRVIDGRRRLYIIVTSWQPDPYVNVLAYTLQHFKLSQIYFISIAEHGYVIEDDAESERKSLSKIRAGVEDRLRELAEGRYTRRGKDGKPDEVVPVDEAASRFYRNCITQLESLENTSVVIPWSDLDHRLESFTSDGRGIFDVTTLKKNLLVDTVVILISHGCTDVFDFEIVKNGPRSYDERELIHNMTEATEVQPGDYMYRNLIENDHLARAERRLITRSLTVRSLIAVTAAVGIAVLLVEIFFSHSWPGVAIGVVATTAAISAWFAPLLRR
jgi:hypothetical protein